ncbi:hypothetical protein ACQ27_gp407 [Klebsiella phage K64-1]|nr:hypothetical protein ACQ27_gp407 [Klebsiella phage K64-1]
MRIQMIMILIYSTEYFFPRPGVSGYSRLYKHYTVLKY